MVSLVPQVDVLHVHFNGTHVDRAEQTLRGFSELHKVIRASRPIVLSFSGSETNRGDAMKFLGLPNYVEGVCRFTCDDDLIYPPDYTERMEAAAWRLGGPVSAQGVNLTRPFGDYYTSRRVLSATVPIGEEPVDIVGTGCLAYLTGPLTRFTSRDFRVTNMADIWASVAFKRRGLRTHTVAHPGGWLKLSDPTNEDTIYHASSRRDGSAMDRADAMTRALLEHRDLFDI